ncbi:hypothetical protein [Candidatus Endomicrobiellum devescovinae]|jgi:hypothetical protein|uniref:hypothetical protein n=1 Tax=Candidatus Endomicrobiellum devescovinae TaxID=3242322 RepID=UPI002825C380|nr:hypothetical protein [Endomicrobium sp.]
MRTFRVITQNQDIERFGGQRAITAIQNIVNTEQEILRAIEDLRNGLGQVERLAVGWANDVITRIRTTRRHTENLRPNELGPNYTVVFPPTFTQIPVEEEEEIFLQPFIGPDGQREIIGGHRAITAIQNVRNRARALAMELYGEFGVINTLLLERARRLGQIIGHEARYNRFQERETLNYYLINMELMLPGTIVFDGENPTVVADYTQNQLHQYDEDAIERERNRRVQRAFMDRLQTATQMQTQILIETPNIPPLRQQLLAPTLTQMQEEEQAGENRNLIFRLFGIS